MKKLLVAVFAFIMGMSVFATGNWTVNFNLGLGIPNAKITGEDELEMKGIGAEFYIEEQLINKNSLMFEVNGGIGSITVDDFYNGESASGLNMNYFIGIGLAPKNDAAGIFALSVGLGGDMALISKNVSSYFTLKSATGFTYLGANVSGTLSLTERVGLFGSCLFGLPIGGKAGLTAEYGNYEYSDSFSIHGGYFIRPAFGISITGRQ